MNTDFETYQLAKAWKRILARIIDILIVTLIPLIIILICFFISKKILDDWKMIAAIIILNYLVFFLYFTIWPWKFNGQTIGKKMLLIKLVNENNEKISFKGILIREIMLVFIPITLSIAIIILTRFIFSNNLLNNNQTLKFWSNILNRTIYSFIFAWYLGIIITIKIDKKHQLFYDRSHKIYVINKYQTTKKNNTQHLQQKKVKTHIHLGTKQPGNINQEQLNEINDL